MLALVVEVTDVEVVLLAEVVVVVAGVSEEETPQPQVNSETASKRALDAANFLNDSILDNDFRPSNLFIKIVANSHVDRAFERALDKFRADLEALGFFNFHYQVGLGGGLAIFFLIILMLKGGGFLHKPLFLQVF